MSCRGSCSLCTLLLRSEAASLSSLYLGEGGRERGTGKEGERGGGEEGGKERIREREKVLERERRDKGGKRGRVKIQ